MRQTDQLRAELAQKAKDADAQAAQRQTMRRHRPHPPVEEILNQTLDAGSRGAPDGAHARQSPRAMRFQQTLTETKPDRRDHRQAQRRSEGHARRRHTTRFDKSHRRSGQGLAEKNTCSRFRPTCREAEKSCNSTSSCSRKARRCRSMPTCPRPRRRWTSSRPTPTRTHQFELKVATEKAQAAITNVEG